MTGNEVTLKRKTVCKNRKNINYANMTRDDVKGYENYQEMVNKWRVANGMEPHPTTNRWGVMQ